MGLARVLDHRRAVAARELVQPRRISHLAVEMHRDDGTRTLADGGCCGASVDAIVGLRHVHRNGRRTHLRNRLPGRDEGRGRYDHLVPGPTPDACSASRRASSPLDMPMQCSVSHARAKAASNSRTAGPLTNAERSRASATSARTSSRMSSKLRPRSRNGTVPVDEMLISIHSNECLPRRRSECQVRESAEPAESMTVPGGT